MKTATSPVDSYPDTYIRISADGPSFTSGLKELFQYRDLIILFVIREFAVKYKQTILGPLWIILSPFMTSLAYLFVFGGIAKIDTEGVPGILFYMAGTAMWGYFALSLTSNANTFMTNANLMGKVYFPRLTIPISNVITAVLMFFIEISLFVVIYAWFAFHGRVSCSPLLIAVIPLLLAQLGMLGMGCGIILSSLTVRYRDLSVVVGFGVSLWMFATPVVYPLSTVTGTLFKTLELVNPVTAPMEIMRLFLFGTGTVIPWSLAMSLLITVLVFVYGVHLFSKVEKTFIDTV